MSTEGRLHRIDVLITAARVHAALHEWPRAERLLTTAVSESNQMGCGRCQLEARLAIAELTLQRRDKNAKERIASLKKDATASGFLLVAKKASALSE
jgi:hypothetical protein